MNFSRIRLDSKGVSLSWTEQRNTAPVSLDYGPDTAAPAPEFEQALQAFVPFTIEICELPADYATGLRITGIALDEGKDGRGLVVNALRDVAGANSPLNLHTPRVRSKKEDGVPDGRGLIPDAVEKLIARAERAAESYLKGERAQQSLELEDRLDEPPVRPTEDGIEQVKAAANGDKSKSRRSRETVGLAE